MNPLEPRANHQFDPFEPHPELDDVDISHLEKNDWNNNSDPFGFFANKGVAPPKLMKPADAGREAKDKAATISRNFRKLHAILDRHEAVIRRRWEKKTRAQRIQILLEAWPNMAKTHRPEFAAFRKYPNRLHQAAEQYRDSFMWPYINQEDLGKPKTLPLLLNARGRNHPSIFAAADGDAMHLGNVSLVLVPIFLNGHVMLLNGITHDESYGKIISWDEHEDAFDWMHTRKQFMPGEGLAILEAQSRLLAFLVRCCELILHEIPSSDLTSNAHHIQPEPPLKANEDPSGLTSLTTLAEEAPYRVPAKLDLANIESLLAARAARAEQHMLSLREDPGYFAEVLLEAKEHRQEMIKDVEGNVHPTLKFPREKTLWARIIGGAVLEASIQLEMFSQLRDQARKLRKLQQKYAAQISPLKDLPDEYLTALLKFRHYLQQTVKGPIDQLRLVVVASPPLRKYFVREVPISASSTKMTIRQKPGVKIDDVVQELIYLLRTLWEDEYDLFLYRLPVLVDELDRLVQSEPKAREFLSPYIAYLLGELSIVGECLTQLQVYQPWANGFDFALVKREADIKRQFAESTKTAAMMMGALHESNLTRVCEFGNPSDNKFDYPVGRRRNKANVAALRSAEANLDLFWAKIDDLIHSRVGGVDAAGLPRLLGKPQHLQRTPEWVEPTSSQIEKSTKAPQPDVSVPTTPFSNLSVSASEPSSVKKEVLAAATAKSKAKSRGTPHAVPADTTSATTLLPVLPEAPSVPQTLFSVDARALKVFRIVFFDPFVNTTPGEVGWNDFLHAMSSVGFAARKLYGSVWHLQPTTLDVERSIQFHEPHPQGKIPFLVARRHGRRLSRAYGWHGGMFVLRDKTSQAGAKP